MNKKENNLTRNVEDIIKENRRQLEDIKNMRMVYNQVNREEIEIPQNKVILSTEKNKFEEKNDVNYNVDELVQHINVLNEKLTSKKNKMHKLKENCANLYMENNNLTTKLIENENFRENLLIKLDHFEGDVKNNETVYLEREATLAQNFEELEFENKQLIEKASKRENFLIQNYQELENEKNSLEEKLKKLEVDYNLKINELKYLNQKIKDFEYYVEENTENNGHFIKTLKNDVDELKNKVMSYEKMFEILIYFFKKVNNNECENFSLQNLDINILQQNLIELENKLNYNNSFEDKLKIDKNGKVSEVNDSVNHLTDRIKEVTNENRMLKKQLQEILSINYKKNNYQIIQNEREVISKNSDKWEDQYKNLEKRLHEIERELTITKANNTQISNHENRNNYNEEDLFYNKISPYKKIVNNDKELSNQDFVNIYNYNEFNKSSKILSKLNNLDNSINLKATNTSSQIFKK